MHDIILKHTSNVLKEVKDDGILAIYKDGKSFDIKADNVIVSIGYNPLPLEVKGKNIHLVGDCNGVGNLRTVIWRAWDVAMRL